MFTYTCTYSDMYTHVGKQHVHAFAAKVVLSFYLAGYDKDKLWTSFNLYRIYSSDEQQWRIYRSTVVVKYFWVVCVLFRYFLSNIAEAISLFLASW